MGEDPGSQVYVRNKQKACEKAGIDSQLHRPPAETTTDELLALIDRLNRDPAVHGILVQLPLPKRIDETRVLDAVNPLKDVDAFHPENVGRLVQGRPRFLPCTPHGIQQMLLRNNIPIAGANVVVVGRSDIVGKPMAIMLMQRGTGGDATVTVCHSRTRDLPAVTRPADILIVAIGRPKFITADMVKPGAVVIDVGMNRTGNGPGGRRGFRGRQGSGRPDHARPRRRRPADGDDAPAQHAHGRTIATGSVCSRWDHAAPSHQEPRNILVGLNVALVPPYVSGARGQETLGARSMSEAALPILADASPRRKPRRKDLRPGESSATIARPSAAVISPCRSTSRRSGRISNTSAGTCCTSSAAVFTEEDDWYLLVQNRCKHLRDDNLCGIYETRPQICRDYTTADCEYDDDWVYDHYWETPEQVEEYAEAVLGPAQGKSIRSPKPGKVRDRLCPPDPRS